MKRIVTAAALCLAVFAAVADGAPAPSREGRAPSVSLRVPSQVETGAAVVASGTARRAPEGARVVLQLRRDRGWGRVAGKALRRRAFSLRFVPPAGRETVRVRAALAKRGATLATSPARTIRLRHRAPVTAPPPSPGAPAGPPAPEDPLSAASLMRTVERYASRTDHLSDTANGEAALDEFSAALGAAGLRLGEQAFTYPRFSVTAVGLSADGAAVPSAAIFPYLYSGTTGPGGVTAQLFDGGAGSFDKAAVAGKIVVVSLSSKSNSSSPNLYPAIEAAVEGGAEALVAVTQAVGDHPRLENSNARRGTGPMPVLFVGKRSGAPVIAAAGAGETGTVTLAADTSGLACERDVWGELEGADPNRRVFVATPASSLTPSASEHGSAYAIVIGLARHYAALPRSARPETLVFMAMGGHEVGWLGLQALLDSSRGAWFKGADAYLHLGSGLGAPTATEQADGTVVTTPTPDPSGRLHNSENPLLDPAVLGDFAGAGVPTANKPPHEASGGEQTYAYAAGIPMVSFSGSSLYFHTAGDVATAVDPTILARDADAFRRSLERITALAPGELKAANGEAEAFGAAIDPDDRAPVNPTLLANRSGGPPPTPVAGCP